MTGLLVVGLRPGAAEGAVAAALSAVLHRAGEPARVEKALEYETVASPVIAARHAGDTIDPERLAESLRLDEGPVLAALPGGILGALTARYTVRDLAARLRLPVVFAAPAGPDATNLVRLSLAAARAARLTVVAVVLTGWPDPPDRVQLDERRLLGELAGVNILTLPASPGARADAVRDWPVVEWLDARPPEPVAAPPVPAAAKAQAPVTPAVPTGALEPYAAWTLRPTGDPRATPRPRIMEAMLEIVTAEGPMLAPRAYVLYNLASGGRKLTTIARAPLSSALHWLAQERRVVLADDVVRLPDQPAVRLRELGERTLEEVPLEEIAELMRRLGTREPAALKRGVLTTYGLIRLTQRADEYLNLAMERL
ncbi:MAG: AAA family ATPase [Solirubrobacteraceae bacterium]